MDKSFGLKGLFKGFRQLVSALTGFVPRKTLPLSELVPRVFCEEDRAFAMDFYTRWPAPGYLMVELGDGHDMETKDAFFRSAWFYLMWPPAGGDNYWILGIHAEDEMGQIVVKNGEPKVYYSDYIDEDGEIAPNSLVLLAPTFKAFLDELHAAGWDEMSPRNWPADWNGKGVSPPKAGPKSEK